MTRIEIEHTLSGIRRKLLNIAERFIRASGTTADAEDFVQDAMAELWMLFESGYPIRNVEALAVKITKTVCVRNYRKRKILTTSIEGKEFSAEVTASEKLDLQDALNARKVLWSRLNETQKRYLEMRDEKMMSLDEIAVATGHPKSSIKATISQARKMMKEQLEQMSK